MLFVFLLGKTPFSTELIWKVDEKRHREKDHPFSGLWWYLIPNCEWSWSCFHVWRGN